MEAVGETYIGQRWEDGDNVALRAVAKKLRTGCWAPVESVSVTVAPAKLEGRSAPATA